MQENKVEPAAGLQDGVASEVRGFLPGTKIQIFNTALRLFASNGVENVSVRDIATAVGIKAASIYNHYINKEQIVEACYDFFLKYYDSTKINEEQYTNILQQGTKEEIVNISNYQFPEELEENLINAMIILFSRMYTDAKAKEKFTTMIDHSLQFLERFFELGIELGRFEKFNVRGVSLLFLSARLFFARSTTVHPQGNPDSSEIRWQVPETLHDLRLVQQEMMLELINIIPFKY